MAIDDQIEDNYNMILIEEVKKYQLSSGKIDKCKYLTGKEIFSLKKTINRTN